VESGEANSEKAGRNEHPGKRRLGCGAIAAPSAQTENSEPVAA